MSSVLGRIVAATSTSLAHRICYPHHLMVAQTRYRKQSAAALENLKLKETAVAMPPPVAAQNPLHILLISESANSMTQRVLTELQGLGHRVDVKTALRTTEMAAVVEKENPQLIICPFLKTVVPPEISENKERSCWIVHPGILGDRGPSSLDWAVESSNKEWGVTILEASEVMDHGDIWATINFPVPENSTKSSLYRFEAQEAAVKGIKQAVQAFQERYETGFAPRVLDYKDSDIKGTLLPPMSRSDRIVDWNSPLPEIERIIRASDSNPGAIGTFPTLAGSHEFRLFGATIEKNRDMVKHLFKRFEAFHAESAEPGSVLGYMNGAILVAAGGDQEVSNAENALWITHLKPGFGKMFFKNKAHNELPIPEQLSISDPFLPSQHPITGDMSYMPMGEYPTSPKEIFMWRHPTACVTFLHLDFNNGAYGSGQCWAAKAAVKRALRDLRNRAKREIFEHPPVLVLMGGSHYFSNGIDLNSIEAAQCPTTASWININAINDIIQAFTQQTDIVTVAALRRNAGAGGAMMAAACDHVISNGSVVLNPSYKAMHLHGSEYWTYFLARRVGQDVADAWTTCTSPVGAEEAHKEGLIDEMVGTTYQECDKLLPQYILSFAKSEDCQNLWDRKQWRDEEKFIGDMESAREYELSKMKACFRDQRYHDARKNFVLH